MFWQIFDDAPDHTRGKVMCMYAILIPCQYCRLAMGAA